MEGGGLKVKAGSRAGFRTIDCEQGGVDIALHWHPLQAALLAFHETRTPKFRVFARPFLVKADHLAEATAGDGEMVRSPATREETRGEAGAGAVQGPPGITVKQAAHGKVEDVARG
jgi:hypothetical protein